MKRCAREVAERKKMLAQRVRDKEVEEARAEKALEAAKAVLAALVEETGQEETGQDTVDAVDHCGRIMFLN